MKYVTGCQLTDYIVYNYLSDVDLLNISLTSKSMEIKDDYYRYRIKEYYGDECLIYNQRNTYKELYIDIVKFLYQGLVKWYKRPDLLMIAINEYGFKLDMIKHWDYLCNNDLKILQQIINIFNLKTPDEGEYIKYIFPNGFNVLEKAIQYGNLEVVRWLVEEHNLVCYNVRPLNWCRNVNVLKYIYEKFKFLPLEHANELSIVKWLVSINRFFVIHLGEYYDESIWSYLIENNYIQPDVAMLNMSIAENLEWTDIFINKYGLVPSQEAMETSIRNNNVNAIKFLYKNYGMKPEKINTGRHVENLEVLQYLSGEFGLKPSRDIVSTYIYLGYFRCLRYIYENFGLLPTSNELYFSGVRHNIPIYEIPSWLLEKVEINYDQEYVYKISCKNDVKWMKHIYDKYNIIPSNDTLTYLFKSGKFAVWNYCQKILLTSYIIDH